MTAKNPNYIRQRKEGLSSLTMLIPTAEKEKLERKAYQEGLNLAAYLRTIILGKQFGQLKDHKKKIEN